jgi:hypothetical protein
MNDTCHDAHPSPRGMKRTVKVQLRHVSNLVRDHSLDSLAVARVVVAREPEGTFNTVQGGSGRQRGAWHSRQYSSTWTSVCVRVRVCARARACVCMYECMYVYVYVYVYVLRVHVQWWQWWWRWLW